MRFAALILIAVTGASMASAQKTADVAAITADFSLMHSPCAYRHDESLEKILQVVAVKVTAPKSDKPETTVTLELRNASSRPITAYVLTYTITRGSKTDYYGAIGKDLTNEIALERTSKKSSSSNNTFPPGQTNHMQLWRGRSPGQFNVYPCMVAFGDRTGIGPPQVFRFVMGMRQNRATFLGMLIADLEAARGYDDPKSALIARAKRTRNRRVETSQRADRSQVVTNAPSLAPFLGHEASQLIGRRDVARDRQTLTDDVSILRAQHSVLLEHSTIVAR